MYKKRHIEQKLTQLSLYSKVMLITGARQVGKSTMLEHLFPSVPLVTFDPFEDVLGAKKDPMLFLKNHPSPIILDEIQFVPQLLNAIKRLVDKSPAKPQYLLTGSQNLSMLKTVSESLAGRVTILQLSPMTIYEQFDHTERPSWLQRYLEDPQNLKSYIVGRVDDINVTTAIWRGGMPGYQDVPNELFHSRVASYLETYIARDVRATNDIESVEPFVHFVGIMAALTAQEINQDQLGREIDIAGATAKKWLALLTQSYQWRSIPAYHGNALKRIAKKHKGYFTDTGLACYLQFISTPAALLSHPLRGALFETYMANTIQALLGTLSFEPQLYHWRSNGGAEVDLVISFDNKLYPIEIKMASSLSKYDARGIQAFKETYKASGCMVMPGIIIYAGEDCYHVEEDVLALPWNSLAR